MEEIEVIITKYTTADFTVEKLEVNGDEVIVIVKFDDPVDGIEFTKYLEENVEAGDDVKYTRPSPKDEFSFAVGVHPVFLANLLMVFWTLFSDKPPKPTMAWRI